jgi:hypothetical protein
VVCGQASRRPVASRDAGIGANGTSTYASAVAWARCVLADAFEAAGQPDSAAAYVERMTSGPSNWCHRGGSTWPIGHQRIVLLFARRGRLADAEGHRAVRER